MLSTVGFLFLFPVLRQTSVLFFRLLKLIISGSPKLPQIISLTLSQLIVAHNYIFGIPLQQHLDHNSIE